MFRKFLEKAVKSTEQGRLKKLRPLAEATIAFFFKPNIRTLSAPHIRDSVDLKRWMMVVLFALTPAIIMAIWNTGVQSFVYTSSNYEIMDAFLETKSFGSYLHFCFDEGRYWKIIALGLRSFVPIMTVSYLVGGFWEVLFASIRNHEINEGFLITGMLFPLSLPPTMPLWMVACGISFGIVIGKELFGGTGMNILNPALTARAFLFFSFPARMTGEIWAGRNPIETASSIATMNAVEGVDGYSQASPLAIFHLPESVQKVQVDAIAMHLLQIPSGSQAAIFAAFARWKEFVGFTGEFAQITFSELKEFITSPAGLNLSSDSFLAAVNFTKFQWGLGHLTNGNLFFGNRLGAMGETSIFASILGAILLIYTKIGSWRTMVSVILGGLLTASAFHLFSLYIDGIYAPAKFAFPVYKQLLMGSFVFGAVFFATDPVSSPTFPIGRYIYGFAIGALIMIIRYINPAFPEGVGLAIIFMNVFVPLIDQFSIHLLRRKRNVQI